MPIKTILAGLRGEAPDATILATAGGLAKRFDAHVSALHVEPDPGDLIASMPIDVGGGAFFMEELTKSIQASSATHRDAAKRAFSDWRKAAGIAEAASPGDATGPSADLALEIGLEQSILRDRALLADLVILGLAASDDIDASLALEAALLDAGRPLLALPHKVSAPAADGPVAIAWNASAESARALAAALPIITGAKDAVILHAGAALDDGALARARDYLGWHGVKARIEELGNGDSVDILLADRAAALGAAMLVMGAYTHSRARELVFGGVTRHMLKESAVPLLLSH